MHTCMKHTHTPYGCIITESEAALRNNYRGWLLLLLLIPTNKPVHKQDGGVRSRSSHFCDTAPSPSYPCVLVSFWFVFIWTNESTQTPKCCTQDLYLYRAKSQQKLPQGPQKARAKILGYHIEKLCPCPFVWYITWYGFFFFQGYLWIGC